METTDLWIWGAAGAVALFLWLRSLNEQRPEMPEQAEDPDRDLELERSALKRYRVEEDWEGDFEGVPYAVEVMDGETFTVSIALEGKLSKPLEINGRESFPAGPWDDARDADIRGLLKEGATYIDIGVGTDWVAAEIPIKAKRLERDRAERVAAHLIRLRRASA